MSSTFGPRPFHPGTPWELFRFESPEVGTPAAVAEPAAPEEPAGEPAAPEWAGPSREDWEASQQSQRELLAWAAEQAQRAGRPEPLTVSPFDDDFMSQLDRYLDQRLAPISQFQQGMEQQQGEDYALDVIADNAAQHGEFYGGDQSNRNVLAQARELLPDAIRRFGDTPKAGEFAIEQACKSVREYEEAIGKSYHERQVNQLTGLAGAPREPGGAAGAAQITAGPYSQGQRVTDRFFGRG